MPTVRVQVPLLPEGLILQWNDKKVALPQKSNEAKLEWRYLKSLGLHGKYGHLLDPENCWFTDLVIAIAVRVGKGGYSVNAEGEEQLTLEESYEKKNPLPFGATY